MNHTTLLNHLIAKHNLKSYLEIGVKSTEQNFDKIKCEMKIGVDPEVKRVRSICSMTSDEYFANLYEGANFDLIFIDGLHHADQVERDFNNSLKCLNDGGFIVLHDTCPTSEQYTTVPRQTKIWFGDVYSFAMNLGLYHGLNFITLDEDCGITICWKQYPTVKPPKELFKWNWSDYVQSKSALLQIGTIEQFNELKFKNTAPM
jgi:hypothetical protein